MADKETPINDTAEYKFSEDEEVRTPTVETGAWEQQDVESATKTTSEEFAVESPSIEEGTKFPFISSLKNINWRRFAVPGSIIISIFLLYLGFNFYAARRVSVSEQQKLMVQEKAGIIQEAAEPAITISSRPEVPAVSNEQVSQMEASLQQKLDNVIQQVESSQNDIANVNEQIFKTQQDINNINLQIEQLMTSLQQVLMEIEKITSSLKGKQKKVVAKLPVPYHVRAIVPGRVWLESADGKSVTLRVGDKLEGYGEVRVISPRQGMVIMSNGSIIQYGVNDF